MEKTYCNFMDEISGDELYEGLLAYGFFAEKLPPLFTAVPFYNYGKELVFNSEWHGFISFSSVRNTNIPRTMGIATPMKYQKLCRALYDNWDEIKEHFHTKTDGEEYRVSRIHLRKRKGTKSLFMMNYKDWRVDGNPETDLLITNSRTAKYLVQADISTCFPSIYTHSLIWALVGKQEAKVSRKDDNQWYNKLDKACSSMKNGETHGLLIGPHASNLLSEIILTSIDRVMYDKGYRYVRNIDDFDCYVESYEKAQIFLRDLEAALREYDLPLNHKKTKITELPIANAESWIHKLNGVQLIASYGKTSYKEISMYLDTAVSMAQKTGNSSALKYAIKSLCGQKITENGKKAAAKRLMHISVMYPYLLSLMEEYVFKPYEVDSEEIKKFSNAVYTESKRVNNYEGICYAIYFSLLHGFYLEELDTAWVIEQKDCILLCLTWVYYLKANHGNRHATEVKPLLNEAKRLVHDDMDRYWLFCYEALTPYYLTSEWKAMKQAGVSFLKEGLLT